MIAFKTRIDNTGFWYQIQDSSISLVVFEYMAIGLSGKQSTGEIQVSLEYLDEWIYYEVGFPLMYIGITGFQSFPGNWKEQAQGSGHIPTDNPVFFNKSVLDDLSRRRMIKTFAAGLLGATMLPVSGFAQENAAYSSYGQSYSPYQTLQNYSPYGTEQYQPYDFQ